MSEVLYVQQFQMEYSAARQQYNPDYIDTFSWSIRYADSVCLSNQNCITVQGFRGHVRGKFIFAFYKVA